MTIDHRPSTIDCFSADLHIHTALSPCGELEMLPTLIVQAAAMAGLDIIGIADHNSCENAGSVIEASKGSGVKVLPGLEVQSVEGVHLLCLFDSLDRALEMQRDVYANLPSLPGAAKYFEEQLIVNGADEFVDYCRMPLSVPVFMDIEAIYERARGLDGLVIPSHIDRHGTGICDVLGMLPDSPVFEAVELSANITADDARERFPSVGKLPLLANSDSHWLAAIGLRRTEFHLAHRSVKEIAMALRREDGRWVQCVSFRCTYSTSRRTRLSPRRSALRSKSPPTPARTF